jgi:hypothetical protein
VAEDRRALARAFVAKAVLGVPTTRALIERLGVDKARVPSKRGLQASDMRKGRPKAAFHRREVRLRLFVHERKVASARAPEGDIAEAREAREHHGPGRGLGYGRNGAEQTRHFAVDAVGEIEDVRASVIASAPERQCPEAAG